MSDAPRQTVPDSLLSAAFASLNDSHDAQAARPTYEVGDIIDSGGMGVVYKSQQLTPIRRIVAMKVLRRTPVAPLVSDRIAKEATALGRLDHPSIPKVFDRGVLPDGRPFFTMEFIEGPSLLAWCDEHRASLADRVRMLIVVADALHHAHARGILHRDVKSSNILVATVDGRPLPRLIDFGIARGLDEELGARKTLEGAVIGTLECMAPEQVVGDLNALGPATDTYALGALLTELLVGAPPFDGSRLRSLSPAELQEVILHEDPPSLEKRFADAGAFGDEIASRRRTDIAGLSKTVRGDIAAVASKALEKAPARRYTTAQAFADDLRAWLDGRPVSAKPLHWFQTTYRFAKRHRVAAAVVSTILGLLVGGLLLMTYLWQSEKETALREAELRTTADNEKRAAVLARDSARVALTDANTTASFMTWLLGEGDTARKNTAALEIIARADRVFEKWVTISPGAEARIRRALGYVYYYHADYARSGLEFERSIRLYRATGEDHDFIIRHLKLLVTVSRSARGETEEAIRDAKNYIELAKAAVPPDPVYVAQAELALGHVLILAHREDEAIPIVNRARAAIIELVSLDDADRALADRLVAQLAAYQRNTPPLRK